MSMPDVPTIFSRVSVIAYSSIQTICCQKTLKNYTFNSILNGLYDKIIGEE
jgi:hypothetical protein